MGKKDSDRRSTRDFVGILMLDTAFPRITGDVGNPASYPFPVRPRVVAGAESKRIVAAGAPEPEIASAFVQAARDLEAEGAIGLISSCGFLIHLQAQIAQAVSIPVILSALSLGPLAEHVSGTRPCGIITANGDALDEKALAAAGLGRRNPVAGMQGSKVFQDAILAPKAEQSQFFDANEMQKDVLFVASKLIEENPTLGAIILECGNLPPYAQAIHAAVGRPVFSILDAGMLLWRTNAATALDAIGKLKSHSLE